MPRPRPKVYHHTIPRFILKYFQSTPPLTRKQVDQQKKRTGKDPRKLRVFNLSTEVLDELSFDDAYGVHNLYRDYKNINDIDEVETKLGRLVENPSVELIQLMHKDAASGRDVVISREKLERLRKFIFIMFFRKVPISHHFFDVNHPDNAAAPQWIEEFATEAAAKRGGGSATALDMWLHALAYILDTPHNDLIKRGSEYVFGSGGPRADPTKDPYGTVANSYATLGGCYYLQIWQAAPGREFVLTDNNLGLFEGLANFSSGLFSLPETLQLGLHRLFVISPTMLFVLRLRENMINMMARGRQILINSNLDKIPKIPPVAKTVGDLPMDENIHQYRAGPGQKDEFTFTITKLTPEQTDQVNFVFLREVRKNGFLSFKDTKLCGELLARYWKVTYFADVAERPKLQPLYSKLVPRETRTSNPPSVQTSSSVPEPSVNRSTPSSSTKSDIAASLPGLKGRLRF
ncbi:hypothetical protein F5887DRAFT_458645 [Amanita rubescens]|nr:hypothetical protein F5887DRAFT_458645 [Amanita rubescens]